MSYLLDKKTKRNRIYRYSIFILFLIIFVYFRAGIFSGLSYVSQGLFHPVLVLGNNIGNSLSNTSSYFYSKKSLLVENESLKSQLNEQEARIANYNSVLDENSQLKEVLGRKNEKINMVLAGILSKPNQSPYDTLLIDVGTNNGISIGQRVFTFGNVPIGKVDLVYPNSSKVTLFSNPGEKTEVVISGKGTSMQVVGRGGGNFEMILPRDLVLEKGTQVVLPGVTPYLVGVVQTIVSDPRDSFQKALLTSPVNIQELNFVEVEK